VGMAPVCRKKTGIGRSGFPRGLVSHTMERMASSCQDRTDVYSFDDFLRDQNEMGWRHHPDRRHAPAPDEGWNQVVFTTQAMSARRWGRGLW